MSNLNTKELNSKTNELESGTNVNDFLYTHSHILQADGYIIDQTYESNKMEKLEETDNITKNIVREICRECKAVDIIVDENFCVYYVKLLMLNPKWGISAESTLNRHKISKLVNYCREQLSIGNDPHIMTLKIQYLFKVTMRDNDTIVASIRDDFLEEIQNFKADLTTIEISEKDKTGEQKLFKKIVIYVNLMCSLGDPKDNNIMKEGTAATQSVFEEEDLKQYIKMNKKEREKQLKLIQDLVMGIRIYNATCGKSAFSVDMTKLLEQSVEKLEDELRLELQKIMEKVNILTTLIIFCYQIFKDTGNDDVLNLNVESGFDPDNDVSKLIACRQHEIYMRVLLREIENNCKRRVRTYKRKMETTYKEINDLVKFKVAIPTTQIYPLFLQLAEVSYKLQDEIIILSTYDQLFRDLKYLLKTIEFDFSNYLVMLKDTPVLTDCQRLSQTMHLKITKDLAHHCKIINVEDVDLNQHRIEYHGFCPWYLVETDGGLVPGNPNMGLLKWKDKYYAFSCLEAVNTFSRNPERLKMRVIDICRNRPDLINFMNLQNKLMEMKNITTLCEKPMKMVLIESVGVQTETHPIPTHIDKNYKWNVWDLYREAIGLANISNCVTHSAQTVKSHFRVPVRIQTTEPRDKTVQTKGDNYTNVPTLSNFIFGLRGRKDDVQHIIELTRPVDE